MGNRHITHIFNVDKYIFSLMKLENISLIKNILLYLFYRHNIVLHIQCSRHNLFKFPFDSDEFYLHIIYIDNRYDLYWL